MNQDDRTVTLPRQERIRLSHYHFGATAIFAARVDQRFSWCAYIPSSYERDGDQDYPLAVVLHGTERDVLGYRDQFATWAEENQCIVLSPLFPAGIIGQRDLHNYKWINFHGIRFDHILIGMVDELRDLYRIRGSQFLLHGFSGGGHFVHRFLYLHPQRLLGASIGAPGVVTLLDPDKEWWVGVKGLEREFGMSLDLAGLRRVPVQMVVGDLDLETWEITIEPGESFWMNGINDTGKTRPERLRSLEASFESAGVEVRFDLVPGATHDGFAVLEPVKSFFTEVLSESSAGTSSEEGDGSR